jgi:hypothetical protein
MLMRGEVLCNRPLFAGRGKIWSGERAISSATCCTGDTTPDDHDRRVFVRGAAGDGYAVADDRPGEKKTYVYKNMKIVFLNDKVSDVQ